MFAKFKYEEGPSVIKSEKALNVNFIYITPKENHLILPLFNSCFSPTGIAAETSSLLCLYIS